MKINYENYLQNIDASFKNKAKKDIYMIYVMSFAMIFAFSYLLFWDSSEIAFKKIKEQVTIIESKISNDNLYLQQNPATKITLLEEEIKQAQSELLIYKDNNAYIKGKIEAISSLVYDERTWGEYLHSISKNALKYNIKILDFTNKLALNNSAFGHVLDINISSTGDYKNTLNFMNSLEQSELVVDLHDLNLTMENNIIENLNISVWGITY
ncbi:MAG: type 4a pilus biogenesis protein PilO [Campylobacterales bacterium]|nr:type 4a pilus biogenesis protein PilO [Campylobacterales bacterium]